MLASRRRRWGAAARFLVAATLLLAGCNQRPANQVPIVLNGPPYNETLDSAGQAVMLPAGDYHLVTVRKRAGTSGEEVLCTEPSPDWAVAYGTALSLSGSGSSPNGLSVSASGSFNTTEALTAMAGRTAGVVALRDGLYSACQAYANGIIGKDAYALILSQYGNLLVALAGSGGGSGGGSSDKSSSSSSSGGTSAGPVAVSVSTGNMPAAAAPAAKGGGSSGGGSSGDSGAGNAQLAQVQGAVLQALSVACLMNTDKTIPIDRSKNNSNALLDNVCPDFLKGMSDRLSGLIPGPSGSGGKGASTASTLALQNRLKATNKPECDPGKIDGVYGKSTAAAAAKCPDAVKGS